MDDPYSLVRFVAAQSEVYEQALSELREGRKQTHWMWFIFPQMRGLGSSAMAQHYGIGSQHEAAAYLAHPVLGARLREATAAVLTHPDKSLRVIFGSPDDLKFCSSMTLFAAVDREPTSAFAETIRVFCTEPDQRTLMLLGQNTPETPERAETRPH